MSKKAREVILVTDGSKFGKTAMAKVGNLRDVTYLVADKMNTNKNFVSLRENKERSLIL